MTVFLLTERNESADWKTKKSIDSACLRVETEHREAVINQTGRSLLPSTRRPFG